MFSRDGITVTHVGGPRSAAEVSRERARPEITARAEGDAIAVELSGYVYPCTARPLFGARVEGGTLIIFRDSYTGSLSRCAGFHRASLRIDGVPHGSYAISLRTERDMPLASTTVVIGAASPETTETKGQGDASTRGREVEPRGSTPAAEANQ